VIRDAEGRFVEIIEQADATPEQREIREVFPSYYCVRSEELLLALSRLKNENRKKEYYLTDIYGILRRANHKVVAVQAVTQEDVLSVNDRDQQAQVDAIMQDRIQRQLRQGGVTIVSPVNTYVEAGTTIGPDTIVRPFTFIGRDSTIGPACEIGPFACIPPETIVPEGSTGQWKRGDRSVGPGQLAERVHVEPRRRQAQSLHRPGQPPSSRRRSATSLQIPLGRGRTELFPDGELIVKSRKTSAAATASSSSRPATRCNAHLMELMIWIDWPKRASAERVHRVIPSFGTQDRTARTRAATPTPPSSSPT
jgi:hypothetical protein